MFSCWIHGWSSKEKPCPLHKDGNIYLDLDGREMGERGKATFPIDAIQTCLICGLGGGHNGLPCPKARIT